MIQDDELLGRAIYKARKAAKLSQKRLGDQIGLSANEIRQIEFGVFCVGMNHHRRYLVKRLCHVLGVEYGDGR